jgi:hypothetical protein
MPFRIGSQLNRTITAYFDAAEIPIIVVPVSAYTAKVSQPKGISMTGFEATMVMLDPANVNPLNGMDVELLENTMFPSDQASITALLGRFQPDSVFYIRAQSDNQVVNIHRQFTAPLQLRYGTSYAMYARALLATITGQIFITLTLFGYENADETQPVIQLR